MPKILENIREKLLEEAKRQVCENGYSSMTIRSVAAACGVGTGTVYNYFQSKDMLVASFMLDDWLICRQAIEQGMIDAEDAKEALYCIYRELKKFNEMYSGVFVDENAEERFTSSFMKKHHLLRRQIAEPLKVWTGRQDKADVSFLAEFIAENMLTLTIAGKDFESIASVLLQLF